MNKFNCIKCGLCCQKAGLVHKQLDVGGGRCVHLGDDNLCKIYEDRPWFCRIDENIPLGVTRDEWYQINYDACRKLGAKI